ncbi:MAG TPA: tRNA pseudouridine(55) synthase TruB, partial [Terrimesophilobacter sp.]|nr:tRNA pseudouridine(55) synthase TruB [Terrimesophilobacter sp.]
QIPSSVSAIKVDGRRAHERMRAGETVELAARAVTVSEFVTTSDPIRIQRADSDGIEFDVRVACSSGTYVRAHAR